MSMIYIYIYTYIHRIHHIHSFGPGVAPSGSKQEALPLSLSYRIMSSLPARRKKSAADRRAQRLRAEGRMMQRMLKCLGEVSSHRGCKLSRLGEVLANTLQSDIDVLQPNSEAMVTPEDTQQQDIDMQSALFVVTERDLQAGSAFPLGARIGSRRLPRDHFKADMLNTPKPPSANDCKVCNDSVRERAACPAAAQTEASASSQSQPQPGIVVQWSGLNQGERLFLSSSRQAASVSDMECLRCRGGMRVRVLSEALCRHCHKALSRAPAAQCTLCNFTLCIACRIRW